MKPPEPPKLEPCEHRGLTMICSHGRTVTAPVTGPDGHVARLSVVAGPKAKTEKITCTTTLVKGPCKTSGQSSLPHAKRVFDTSDPSAIQSQTDTKLELAVKCAEHKLDNALQFLWPQDNCLIRSYAVDVNTCQGRPLQGLISVYPDMEWEVGVSFGFGEFSDDQKVASAGATEKTGAKTGPIASKTLTDEKFKGDFNIKLTYDGVSNELGTEFRKYTEHCLKAVNAVHSVSKYVAPRLQAFGGIKLTVTFPLIAAKGKWGWKEIPGKPDCGFEYDFSFGLEPLLGLSGEVDLLTALLNATGPIGASLNYLRALLKKGSDPNEDAKLNATIDVYIKLTVSGQIDGTLSYKKDAAASKGTGSGSISTPINFTVEGGGTIEAKALFIKVGAEMKIGGKSSLTPKFTAAADEKGPYIDGVLEFSGVTIYAAVLAGFEGTISSKKESQEKKVGKNSKTNESGSEITPSFKQGVEKEWTWIEERKWFENRTYLITGK